MPMESRRFHWISWKESPKLLGVMRWKSCDMSVEDWTWVLCSLLTMEPHLQLPLGISSNKKRNSDPLRLSVNFPTDTQLIAYVTGINNHFWFLGGSKGSTWKHKGMNVFNDLASQHGNNPKWALECSTLFLFRSPVVQWLLSCTPKLDFQHGNPISMTSMLVTLGT